MSKYSKQPSKILNESNRVQNNKQIQKYRFECNNNPQFKIQKDKWNKYQINRTVQVPLHNLMDFIQIYEWREQTDYPIISSKWNKVIFNKSTPIIHKQQLTRQIKYHLHNHQFTFVQLQMETVSPLANYLPLSFTHYLYALKESLVGFQRLLAMFGTFQIVENMITVNQQGRVKVWISQHYQQNSKMDIDTSKLYTNEQQYMISKIKDIFLKFASSNAIFRQFFQNLQYINTFLHFFKFIDGFTQYKKVIIGKQILKKSHITNKRPLSPIINLKPVGRTPKFIIANKRQIPCLGLGLRQSLHKVRSFNFSQLKTKQTLINDVSEKLTYQQNNESPPTKLGKIIRNNISRVKSLNNLSYEPSTFQIEKSSIEKSFNRLFEQDQPYQQKQKHKKLVQFGRQIRGSIIMK